jgi:hypothetical protein
MPCSEVYAAARGEGKKKKTSSLSLKKSDDVRTHMLLPPPNLRP